MSLYKKSKPLIQRQEESKAMKDKYPDRVCVICEKSINSGDIPKLDKNKYLVPCTLNVGQFIYIIRKRLDLSSSKAIFLFTASRVLPPTSATMADLYTHNKDEDGLLYLTYATENTFGAA